MRGLTAVDGSLLPALPKMAWALWLDPQHHAAKMHVHFDVLKGVPVETTVTAGNGSETEPLRATLQAKRLYVIDRGYADYQLFQDIVDARSDFIGRIRDNAVWTVVEERPLTAEAQQRAFAATASFGSAAPRVEGLRTTLASRSRNRKERRPRPSGNPAPGDQPPRPGRRVGRLGLPVSLEC